jgi:peroxiredoxin
VINLFPYFPKNLKMKKLIPFLFGIVLFACTPAEKTNFSLSGTVNDVDSGMVYLQDRISGMFVTLDSVNLDNGSFILNGSLNFPQMLYLRIDGVPGRLSVFMENSDMKVLVKQKEPVEFEVTGSASHDIYMQLVKIAETHDEELRKLQAEIINAEVAGNEEDIAELRARSEELEKAKKEEIKAFVVSHSNKSVAVFIAQRQLMHGADSQELRGIFSQFDASLKGTRYYDELETTVLALERVAPGKPAVDFTLNNPQGDEVSLSDFRGNVVLISFWASWCPYCRVANPDLVKVYNKYRSDGFEVVGVSLDRDLNAWVKGIEEDGLQWVHVSDLKGWQSGPAAEYAIRSIPQNVLVGTDGTIIGRNLKYTELEEKLNALLSGI